MGSGVLNNEWVPRLVRKLRDVFVLYVFLIPLGTQRPQGCPTVCGAVGRVNAWEGRGPYTPSLTIPRFPSQHP
jgi:hypothetical protein